MTLPANGKVLWLCLAAAALASTAQADAGQTDDLTTLSLEELLDVSIVGASRYEQPQRAVAAAVSVITRQEIRAFGWRSIDEALASLPGVHTTYDRQSTHFGTRGFGLPGDFNTRVLLLIDGIRINEPTYDSGVVGRNFPVDMDLVERIEFIPGPGGAVYGQNAMFGVVNVITRKGRDVAGTEMVLNHQQPHALTEGRVSWGRLLDNGVDVLVSASGLSARGEDRFFDFGPSGISGIAAGMDGERGRQFYARITRGTWSFEHLYGRRRKDDPTGSYFSDPLVGGQYQDGSETLTQLSYESSFAGESLHVSAHVYNGVLGYRTELSYGGLLPSDTQTRWHGADIRVLSTGLAGHALMLGIEGQDTRRSDQLIPLPTVPPGTALIRSPGYRIGVYVQDEWRLAPTLATTLGLRIDRDDISRSRLSPRTALIWQATPKTTVKALYGRAYRSPNAFERGYDDGATLLANPTLRGERIDTLELVTDQLVRGDLTLRASVYRWTMRDLVTLGIEPASGIPQYQSGEKIRANGVELSVDKTWLRGARLRGSLSRQRVAYVSGGGPLNSPKLLGKLNLSVPVPVAGLHLGYELRYDSERLAKSGDALGGYLLSNLTVSRDFRAHTLELSASVLNLFDKRYAQPAADTNWQDEFEQDGRSLRVKLGLRF